MVTKGQIRVLVVDDQQSHAFWLREWLISNNFSAFDVQSIEEAIKTIQQEWPQVVVFDAIIPYNSIKVFEDIEDAFLGGLTVLSWIENAKRYSSRADRKKFPQLTIVVSTLMNDKMSKKFKDCGADYTIKKPFNPSDLLTIIHSHFNKQE